MSDGNDLSSLMNNHRKAGGTKGKVEELAPSKPAKGENLYLAQPEKGLALCAALLANSDKGETVEKMLQHLHHIVEQQFLLHSETGENATAATTYADLQRLYRRLTEMVSFPPLEKSYTVAVGGSFSAGKSFFLNTVLGCPSLLPTDTTPTTSIPTYLYRGQQNSIHALNVYHKKTAIDEEALKAICHSFHKRFGVTFSHLLQLIAVERKDFRYPNLIFLDTPGYSKADDVENEGNSVDKLIAREHLRCADYLIWLVDQQNGTVPTADIEFIRGLELQQPLLVVISKADKRPEEEIRKVIAQATDDLDRAEIDYVEVIAHSARDNREISESGDALVRFLGQIDQSRGGSTLLWRAKEIFREYLRNYDSRQQMLKLTQKTINELAFSESLEEELKKNLEDLKQKTKSQIDAITREKKGAEEISKEYSETLEKLCGHLGIENNPKPNWVELQSARKGKASAQVESEVTLDGMIDGDIKKLSNIGSLNNLQGVISKLSNTFITVQIDKVPGIKILIIKQTVLNRLGDVRLQQEFHEGQGAVVQILGERKCAVTIVR